MKNYKVYLITICFLINGLPAMASVNVAVENYKAIVQRAKIAIKFNNFELYRQDAIQAGIEFEKIKILNDQLDLSHQLQVEQFPRW